MSNYNGEGCISEAFSSIQGEGGSVRGSCFGKKQIFVRLCGCNLAEGAFDSSGCFWCDSKSAQISNQPTFKYEEMPGSKNLLEGKNPVNIKALMEIVKNLITKDLHSIAFTGGEPLCQLDFILSLSNALINNNVIYPLFLETNGSVNLKESQFDSIAKRFKFCCCDIKDKSANATSLKKWKDLVKTELNFIKTTALLGVNTFAKIIVTAKTEIEDIKWISKSLSEIKHVNGEQVGLAIQPVTFSEKKFKDKYSVNLERLNQIFYATSEFIKPESLTLSVQIHKMLDLL